MHIMVITHVSSRNVPLVWTHGNGWDRSTSFGKSCHMLLCSIFCAPYEDHWFQTILSWAYEWSVAAYVEGHDVIGVAKLSFCLLLATLNFLFATAKDLLSSFFSIQDDTESSSHIYRLHTWVVEQVLAGHVALISVYELDLIMYVWSWFDYGEWLYCWLLDSAKPRLARHELVSLWSIRLCKWVIAIQLDYFLLGFFLIVVSNLSELFCHLLLEL